jgi:hypothetical protein
MSQNILVLVGDKNGIGSLWKFQTIIDMFLFWHFKVMLMIPSCAKQLIWVLKIWNLKFNKFIFEFEF